MDHRGRCCPRVGQHDRIQRQNDFKGYNRMQRFASTNHRPSSFTRLFVKTKRTCSRLRRSTQFMLIESSPIPTEQCHPSNRTRSTTCVVLTTDHVQNVLQGMHLLKENRPSEKGHLIGCHLYRFPNNIFHVIF